MSRTDVLAPDEETEAQRGSQAPEHEVVSECHTQSSRSSSASWFIHGPVLPLRVAIRWQAPCGYPLPTSTLHPVQRAQRCGRWSLVPPLPRTPPPGLSLLHPVAWSPGVGWGHTARMTGSWPPGPPSPWAPDHRPLCFLKCLPSPSPYKAFQIIKYQVLLTRGPRWLYRSRKSPEP